MYMLGGGTTHGGGLDSGFGGVSENVGRPGRVQKLTPDQIATQQTWSTVIPETDLIKAASHMIRVQPAGATTVTEMFELDPGIGGSTVGEGRGWQSPPKSYGHLAVHGKVLL